MEDKMDTSTEYMKVRTRGDASPNGKRKVYFTCHPKDFDLYFDKVEKTGERATPARSFSRMSTEF